MSSPAYRLAKQAYARLGVDTEAAYLNNGRPIPVLPSGEPIDELC